MPASAAGTGLPAPCAAATTISASACGSSDGAATNECARRIRESSATECSSEISAPFSAGLAQALRDERVVLAQEAADDEHAIQRVEIGDRHAEPRDARALPVAAEIRLPQPEIDVVRAERAGEPRGERHLLQRRVRRDQRAQRGAAVLAR